MNRKRTWRRLMLVIGMLDDVIDVQTPSLWELFSESQGLFCVLFTSKLYFFSLTRSLPVPIVLSFSLHPYFKILIWSSFLWPCYQCMSNCICWNYFISICGLSFPMFYCCLFFIWKAGRGDKQRALICWSIPQMPMNSCSWTKPKPEFWTQSETPIWVASTQVHEPLPGVSQSLL